MRREQRVPRAIRHRYRGARVGDGLLRSRPSVDRGRDRLWQIRHDVDSPARLVDVGDLERSGEVVAAVEEHRIATGHSPIMGSVARSVGASRIAEYTAAFLRHIRERSRLVRPCIGRRWFRRGQRSCQSGSSFRPSRFPLFGSDASLVRPSCERRMFSISFSNNRRRSWAPFKRVSKRDRLSRAWT